MKITIITVVRNGINTIKDTIDCVLGQSYPNIEYIIIDGCSTDGTIDVIKSYGNKITKFISEKDKGIYDAMNKGLLLATGDYVGFLNSDDFYMHPYVIDKIVEQARTTQADALYGDLIYVDPNNINRLLRYWRAGDFDRFKMLFGWSVPHPTFFVKRRIFDECGLFRENFRISGDYEMMVRFFFKGRISAAYIPEILVKMRAGGTGNASMKARMTANREDMYAWRCNGLHTSIFTVLVKPLRKIPQFIARPNTTLLPEFPETAVSF